MSTEAGRPALDAKSEINHVLSETSDSVKTVVAEILKIETRFIHMTQPRGIHDEIREMIERVVK